MEIKSKEKLLVEKGTGLLTKYGTLRKDLAECMDEYAKQQAIEFFIWHWRNYSSKPNEEELEERYMLFIKSIEQ